MLYKGLSNLSEVPFNQYLVRPKLIKGESLQGYVYRFYESNGEGVPQGVWRLIDEFYKQENPEKELIKKVQNLIKQKGVFVEYNWLKDHRLLAFRNLKSQELLNTAKYRFCPMCINETGLHWSVWGLPMFTACLKHGCRLINCCNNCYALLRWREMRQKWRCHCKVGIKEMQTYPATPFQLSIAQLIFNAKDSPSCSQYKNKNLLSSSTYTVQPLYDALEWAFFFKKKIRFLKYNYLNSYHLISLRTINKAKYGHWESRLLFKEISIKLILKRFSTQNPTIKTLWMGLRLLTVITAEGLYIEKNKNTFTENLIPLFKRFVKQYTIQLESEFTHWLKQSYLGTKKQVKLRNFHDWWFLAVEKSDNKSRCKSQPKSVYRNKHLKKITEDIFKKLIYASQIPNSYLIHQFYFKNWCFPASIAQCSKSNYIMNDLLCYLAKLSKHDLLLLYEKVKLADVRLRRAQDV